MHEKNYFTILISLSFISAQDSFAPSRVNNVEEKNSKNVDVNQVNQKGLTPLILAVNNNASDATQFLLTKSTNINAQNKSGNNTLMGAIYKQNKTMIDLLIANKADVNQVSLNGTSSSMFTATFENIEMKHTLLNSRADKTIKDTRNKTALDHASLQ